VREGGPFVIAVSATYANVLNLYGAIALSHKCSPEVATLHCYTCYLAVCLPEWPKVIVGPRILIACHPRGGNRCHVASGKWQPINRIAQKIKEQQKQNKNHRSFRNSAARVIHLICMTYCLNDFLPNLISVQILNKKLMPKKKTVKGQRVVYKSSTFGSSIYFDRRPDRPALQITNDSSKVLNRIIRAKRNTFTLTKQQIVNGKSIKSPVKSVRHFEKDKQN